MSLTETDFHTHADAALDRLNRSLGVVADEHDVEVLLQNGVLTLEFDEPQPAKMVVSPNTPVRQIWISAQSRSFKLDWNGTDFALPSTNETLDRLIDRLVKEQLGL